MCVVGVGCGVVWWGVVGDVMGFGVVGMVG